MPDSPVAKIESDIRGIVRASYPDMVVHVNIGKKTRTDDHSEQWPGEFRS